MPSPMLPHTELRIRRQGVLEFRSIPPILRPLVRAYLLGYASAVAPRILTLLLQYILKRRQKNVTAQQRHQYFLNSLKRVLCGGLEWQRFATFCAVLVGGSTLLEEPLRRLFDRAATTLTVATRTRLSRWTSTFIAAWLGIRLLQSKKSDAFSDSVPIKSDVPPGVKQKQVRYAGRTLDLSLFAFTRAIDVVVGELWSRRRERRVAAQKWTKLEALVGQSTDPWIFTVSCALIMWTWIYTPTRLPKAYDKWITTAAVVDSRLIQALQKVRQGEIIYGVDTSQAPLLQSMCADYKWPMDWGDPAKSIPFPCEMVHMGCGPSCEYHFLLRFYRGWCWSMATYLPLNLAVQLRKPSAKGIIRATASASRSSAFLGAFIAVFFYGVCLARTRVGPHVIGKDLAARTKIDSGICIGTGCFLCGWSVFIETASRRKDMALFVAPRALATLFPRRYAMDKQWRETIVFAASTAVVFTCVLENQKRVRGVLGNVLGAVLRA